MEDEVEGLPGHHGAMLSKLPKERAHPCVAQQIGRGLNQIRKRQFRQRLAGDLISVEQGAGQLCAEKARATRD
jgi:hypothetical protein